LLTRDLELYQRAIAKGIDAFYLDGRTTAENLSELSRRFNVELDIDMAKSMCTKCNVRVTQVSKEKVADKVEKTTFSYYNEFWECPKCGQVYWQGAHWTKIKKTLEKAKENLRQENKKGIG